PKAIDEAGLKTHAESVLMIERLPLREGDQRAVKLDIPAQPRDFSGNEEALSPVRPDGAVNRAETERWRHRTGHDALQRVRPGDIAEIQCLKQVTRRVAERVDGGVVQGVGKSHALEGMPQKVARRRSKAGARLIVVQQLIEHALRQVDILSGQDI